MRTALASVLVNDQETAVRFYTDLPGFVKKRDVPAGEARRLTVVASGDPDGVELLLEPLGFPPAAEDLKALRGAGVPLTAFAVDDLVAEVARLEEAGVTFAVEPTRTGPVTIAVFDDTCGNLIQFRRE